MRNAIDSSVFSNLTLYKLYVSYKLNYIS